jgi:hypothetical protein
MANVKIAYDASSAVTISLASLATSATWVAGRESTLISNTTNLYLDYLLAGQITVGTTPTSATQIRIYAVAPLNDTPTWPDVFDGTDSAETITSVGVRDGFAKIASVINVDSTTSNRAYYFGPISIASLYGGSLPTRWAIFVTHNTGVNLNATAGNHVISITPVYATIS